MLKVYKISLIIIFIFFLFSCKKQENGTTIIEKHYNVEDSINFNGLSEKYATEFLTYKGEKIFFSPLSLIKPFNNNKLVIYDGNFSVLITDLHMKVEKLINLKNKDYYFNGPIKDLVAMDNCIYLLDNSFILKKLDVSSENISKIEINQKQLGTILIYNLNSISAYGNKLVLSPMMYMFFPKETICLGIIVNNEGEIEKKLVIDKRLGDLPIWGLSGDFIFTSQIGEDIFVCFNTSRKIYRFNRNCELQDEYMLSIDKRYYFNPKSEKVTTDRGGVIATGNKITFTPINNNGLQIDNAGNLYFLMFQGQFGKQKLVRLDSNFQVKDEIIISTINNCCYKMLIVNNHIIFHNGSKVHLYN